MRLIVFVILVALLLIPPGTALDLERVELPGNVSVITSPFGENYYILTLVNQNDFNLTLVENITLRLSFEIDPASVHAVDNYQTLVPPVEIRPRSIIFTYNATIPAGGYGKIFIDVNRLPTAPLPQPKETLPPPPSPPPTVLTNSPPITPSVTLPTPSTQPLVDKTETHPETQIPPTPVPNEPAAPQPPAAAQIIIGILLLEMLAGLITLRT